MADTTLSSFILFYPLHSKKWALNFVMHSSILLIKPITNRGTHYCTQYLTRYLDYTRKLQHHYLFILCTSCRVHIKMYKNVLDKVIYSPPLHTLPGVNWYFLTSSSKYPSAFSCPSWKGSLLLKHDIYNGTCNILSGLGSMPGTMCAGLNAICSTSAK